VVSHYDADFGGYVFRVPGRLPPLTWGLAVGEFAYYLRSALDNLLWQLVIARGGTPTRVTQFPIYEDETDKKGKPNVRWVEKLTDGVLPEDFTFIEGLQPYKAGLDLAKWQPLALLGHLNDVDKHRYVHVAFASAAMIPAEGPQAGRIFLDGFEAEWPKRVTFVGEKEMLGHKVGFMTFSGSALPIMPADGSIVSDGPITRYFASGSDDDPAEVYRVSGARPRHPHTKMKMGPGFLLEVSFSDRERPMTVFDLREVRTAVQQIVDRFAPEIE
jgi:hypothetical protein